MNCLASSQQVTENRTPAWNCAKVMGLPDSHCPIRFTFFKGPHFVRVDGCKSPLTQQRTKPLAAALSQTLDKGEGDIPVLIKHLPNAEEGRKNAIYLHSFSDLNCAADRQQPVLLGVFSPVGNADAVLCHLWSK